MDQSNTVSWQIITSREGETPAIFAEYLLNDLGVFVKRMRRVAKKGLLNSLTGFRVGYVPVPGTDYREGPLDRNAILWRKLTSAVQTGQYEFQITGNSDDKITLVVPPELVYAVQQYIETRRSANPPVAEPDMEAAVWLCWRDDDEWEDPQMPLAVMVEAEKNTERFIDPDVLEETRLNI